MDQNRSTELDRDAQLARRAARQCQELKKKNINACHLRNNDNHNLLARSIRLAPQLSLCLALNRKGVFTQV